MQLIQTERFRKSFDDLDIPTKKKAKKQFVLFINNLFHPSLHTEKLEPKKRNMWSFRVDKQFRVIFTFKDSEKIYLLDIGPHDIYRKL